MLKLDELRAKLMAANEKISELSEKIKKQDEDLRGKERKVRSYAMRTIQLERKLQQQQQQQDMGQGKYICQGVL